MPGPDEVAYPPKAVEEARKELLRIQRRDIGKVVLLQQELERLEVQGTKVSTKLISPQSINVKFKKLHRNAVAPSYAKPGDAGCDLTAVGMLETDDYIEYDIGIAVAIPEGHVGLLFPRSSVSKKDLIMANCVAVIDSGYRGPIKCRFKVTKDHSHREDLKDPVYRIGDRVAQLMVIPFPRVTYQEAQELDDTERGTGGLGSTGD